MSKVWEVLAIAVDGELVCEDCADPGNERTAFSEEVDGISPLFASDATGDEVCDRCGRKIE